MSKFLHSDHQGTLRRRGEGNTMSTRDELEAVLISGFAIKNAVWVENDMPCLRLGEVADYLLSQGWRPPMRVIETVEELDALLPRTMILDGDDNPWAKNSDAFFDIWVIPAGSMERTSADLLREMNGPFRVVWEPEE